MVEHGGFSPIVGLMGPLIHWLGRLRRCAGPAIMSLVGFLLLFAVVAFWDSLNCDLHYIYIPTLLIWL